MADANHVRVLVHAGDVTMTHAFEYYTAYKFEPSKSNNDDMILDEVVNLAAKRRQVTFMVVLEELVKAAGAGFKEVMLVGHGHVEGLIMPVGPPGLARQTRAACSWRGSWKISSPA